MADTDTVLDQGAPKAAPPPPAASPSIGEQLVKSFQESDARMRATLTEEEREKTPVINSAIREMREPGPAVPQLGRESEPPKSNIQQQMQEWMMPIVALSAIAGAFSRQHATTALNAFSAGVQGL